VDGAAERRRISRQVPHRGRSGNDAGDVLVTGHVKARNGRIKAVIALDARNDRFRQSELALIDPRQLEPEPGAAALGMGNDRQVGGLQPMMLDPIAHRPAHGDPRGIRQQPDHRLAGPLQ
jgi:hypothetical protein